MSRLRDAASRLSRILGWDMEDAIWLLLTGRAPYLNPLKVRVSYSRGKPATVKLEVAAWMPAEVVAEKLRDIQRHVLTAGVGKMSERALEVCLFVEDQLPNADPSSVWPSLYKEWRRQHPGKKPGTWRGLRQIYFRNMPTILQGYKSIPPSRATKDLGRKLTEQFIESLEKTAARQRAGELYMRRRTSLNGAWEPWEEVQQPSINPG